MKNQPVTRGLQSSQNLPQSPSLLKTIGPSFILLGLALGSGELIMWPYLTANYGLGIMWGGLLGITFQFFLNTEIMRYTLAWGESVFMGFRKLHPAIPLWFVLSTFIPWSLPGFSSATAQILNHMFPFIDKTVLTVVFLFLTGLILSSGKTLYKTMETFQRTMIMLGLPFILALVALFTKKTDWQELAVGLIGHGKGWNFFPPGIALSAFLGAFAYSGAGGNLNLAQSYYIKEKGFGMGKFMPKISSLLAGGSQKMALEGMTFSNTTENRKRWKQWWRLITTEHFLVFWGLGFLTIVLLSVLSKSLVYGQATASGISFVFFEAGAIGGRLGSFFGTFFLGVVAMMLFSTQTGILESSARIISENVVLLFYKKGQKYNLSRAFYVSLWGQLILAMVLYVIGFKEPRFLLTLAAVLNAAAMMVSFLLMLVLNTKRLDAELRPGLVRKVIMVLAFLFFAGFVVVMI